MKAFYTTLLLILSLNFNAFCQMPVPEFFDGLKLVSTNKPEAKKLFLVAAKKDPQFHGSYHFLGAIYMAANDLDSAAFYLKKAIELNPDNVNHTKELSYLRLINNYTYQHDFKNAFSTAWDCLKLYPENKQIEMTLKDLCQWSFYIKYDHLDPSYLAQAPKLEYVVNNIAQEYLIIRKIRVDDEAPVFSGVTTGAKKGANYDTMTCTLPTSKQTLTIDFKLNWDMMKDFGGKRAPTQPVIADSKSAIYDKVGAMLVADDKTDVKAAIEKLIN